MAISPKSKKRPWQSQSKWKPVWKKREHHNKKFYNSKAWRETRKSYIYALQQKIWREAMKNIWTIDGSTLEVNRMQKAYVLSLDFTPCEQCLKLFYVGVYSGVEAGEQVDHIDPLNPEDALLSEGWGNPFDHSNLQLLCRRHHAKKTNRDKRIINAKT